MNRQVKKLKKIGLKVTPQRLAILEMIKGDRTHPSAENIYNEISRKYPGMSFATVYNTLAKLVETGEIQELDIDPNKKRFDPYTPLHYHFYCKNCGKVYDVDYDISFAPNMHKIGGHHIEAIQLNFKGLCKACSKK
jgi:Fur family transcriptional regulator, peroxide stress response regulator